MGGKYSSKKAPPSSCRCIRFTMIPNISPTPTSSILKGLRRKTKRHGRNSVSSLSAVVLGRVQVSKNIEWVLLILKDIIKIYQEVGIARGRHLSLTTLSFRAAGHGRDNLVITAINKICFSRYLFKLTLVSLIVEIAGNKFAMTMVKLAVVAVVLNFSLAPREIPRGKLELDPLNQFFHTAKRGLWVKFDRLWLFYGANISNNFVFFIGSLYFYLT